MKKTLIACAVMMSVTAVQADDWKYNGDGFTSWNDIEINLDARKNSEGIIDDDHSNSSIRLDDDSRLLIAGQWRTSGENGRFVTAVGEALLKTNAQLEMDDAFVAFGQEESWFFQLGRFEAADLFPVGKDIALEYAAGGDEIGGGVYIYRAHEARGRAANAGQARFQFERNNWTAEVSTVYGDAKNIVGDAENHIEDGERLGDVDGYKDSFMIRPVLNYRTDDGFISVSVGGEWEARKGAVKVKNTTTDEIYDLSDRYGLAATTTLTFGDLAWHISAAHQDAENAWTATSFGTNIDAGRWGVGLIAARNKLKDKERNLGSDYSDPKNYTVYAAYTHPLLGIDSAEVSYGLSYSDTRNVNGLKGSDEKTTMARVRINYYF